MPTIGRRHCSGAEKLRKYMITQKNRRKEVGMKTENSNDDGTGLIMFIMIVIITICCMKTCDNSNEIINILNQMKK